MALFCTLPTLLCNLFLFPVVVFLLYDMFFSAVCAIYNKV